VCCCCVWCCCGGWASIDGCYAVGTVDRFVSGCCLVVRDKRLQVVGLCTQRSERM
jgi:hypothetical protein